MTSPTPLQSPAVRQALLLAAGLSLIFLAFLPPGIYCIDGNAMLAVAESLVTGHGITVPPYLGSPGADGKFYCNWYPLLSVLSIPAAFAAKIISSRVHLPFHQLAAILALPLSGVLTAATAGIIVLLGRKFGARPRNAVVAALCYTFGTIAMVYARTYFAEPLMAFLFIFAFFLATQQTRRTIATAAIIAALAVLAKPTGIVVGPILAVYLIARKVRFPLALLPAAGTVMGFATYAFYNQIRFANALKFGQPWAFGISHVPAGVAGLLFSPGFGLLWYSPAAMLALYSCYSLARKHLMEALAIVTLFLSQLLVHSIWEFWHGGSSWGPRFLLPVLPLVFASAALLEDKLRKSLLVLSLIGFVIGAPTLFAFYERYFAEFGEQQVQSVTEPAWSIEDAAWFHMWPAAIREVRDARSADIVELLGQRKDPARSIEHSRALRVVAVWWWVLPVARIPRWIGAAISLLLCGYGLALTRKSLLRASVEESS